MTAIEDQLGAPSVLLYNAVGGGFTAPFLDIDPAMLDRNFQVNAMGLLYVARRLAPAMISVGKGAIVVTGNTSALRGKAGLPDLHQPKPRSVFWRRRSRVTWGPRECMLPTSSSMR